MKSSANKKIKLKQKKNNSNKDDKLKGFNSKLLCVVGILLSVFSIKFSTYAFTRTIFLFIIYLFILKILLRKDKKEAKIKSRERVLFEIILFFVIINLCCIFSLYVIGVPLMFLLYIYYPSQIFWFDFYLLLASFIAAFIVLLEEKIKDKLRNSDKIVYFLVKLSFISFLVITLKYFVSTL